MLPTNDEQSVAIIDRPLRDDNQQYLQPSYLQPTDQWRIVTAHADMPAWLRRDSDHTVTQYHCDQVVGDTANQQSE